MKKNKHINRRSFISKSVLGAGAIGGLVFSKNLPAPSVQVEAAPVVSMGVMNADNPEVLAESYNMGVRHFDTAWYYQRGRNEEMVGDVITNLGARDQVIIATKILLREGSKTAKEKKAIFLERFEQSLSRLKTDYVDILYLHDVTGISQINVPEIREAFSELKEKKKIRHIGFSTHRNMAEVIEEAMKTDFWEVILVAYNFAMADDAGLLTTLQKAAAKGIGLVGMKTQAGGGWWRNSRQKTEKLSGTLSQTAMLKWVLQHPFITTAVPGYTSFEHMKEDVSVAYDLSYSKDEIKFLEDRDIKLSLGFCRQCQQCLASCPNQVDIPTLMRVHMYLYQYQNTEHAYAVYESMGKQKALDPCRLCNTCSASCANHVAIPQKIEALKQLNLV